MEAFTVVLWILAIVLVVLGVVGLVLPVIPGPVVILAGLIMAAWAEGFVYVGGATIAVLALLALVAAGVDVLAGALGARRFGASRRAMIGAAAGAVVGLFFGIPGIILGPFIGAVAGELSLRKDLRASGLSGIGAWVGLVAGAVAKAAGGFAMIGIFLMVRLL